MKKLDIQNKCEETYTGMYIHTYVLYIHKYLELQCAFALSRAVCLLWWSVYRIWPCHTHSSTVAQTDSEWWWRPGQRYIALRTLGIGRADWSCVWWGEDVRDWSESDREKRREREKEKVDESKRRRGRRSWKSRRCRKRSSVMRW